MKEPLKVVFMGTPSFAVPSLDALLDQGFEVRGVFTQPDRPVGRGLRVTPTPVKERALRNGLRVFQPERLTDPGVFEELLALQPDVLVIVAYGQLLKPQILELPRLGCVNVHSSLLPRWRGAAPIQWALLAGDEETGVSTMRLVSKMDAGPVYEVLRTKIEPYDTLTTLHDRLAQMGGELLVSTLKKLQSGTIEAIPQDETQITFAPKIEKSQGELHPLQDSAQTAHQKIRALHPWPGTYLRLSDGRILKLKAAKLRTELHGKPGFQLRAGRLMLNFRQGSLELETVQWEAKGEVSVSEFLNGLSAQGLTPESLELEGAP
jgi:methionyl-tRNA formyltransferase